MHIDIRCTDPDDIESMIHLLVCSNVVDIEGLISSQVWSDDPDKTERIREVIEQFGQVQPRLKKHAQGYPEMDYLRSIIMQGQPKSNMTGVGQNMDSDGSELIISAVDKKGDDRPVWIAAWGGMNTMAQALWKVSNTRSPKQIRKFISKVRIYDVLGQDDAGAWIAKNFPEIVYIRNEKIYGWAPSDEWIKANIQRCAPFGACYPNRIWAAEGDTPSFLYVYANGLNVPDSLNYGGWGGRFTNDKVDGIRGMDFIIKSGKDETQFDPYFMHASTTEGIDAINKWKQHILNDFAARMAWTTTDDFSAVNHHPVAVVNGDKSMRCIYKKIKEGGSIVLNASESTDPDGNELKFRWSVYNEASSYKGNIDIENPASGKCRVQIPKGSAGKTIHVILELTDKGEPELTGYRRIVINVI